MPPSPRFARVVFNAPLREPFDYHIPPEALGRTQIGARVVAGFGRQRLVGYVAALAAGSTIPAARLRAFTRLIDERPWLNAELLRLSRWLADTCGVSLGEAMAAIVPTRMLPRGPQSEVAATPAVPARHVAALAGESAEWIKAGTHRVVALEGHDPAARIAQYLDLVNAALARGRSALWLVPDIHSATSLIERCVQRWGPAVAVLHGRTSPRQRAILWEALHAGTVRVLLGTRSAVFAPLGSLGLIILDDEHDAGYKQPEMPAYHARTVALERARRHHATVVLGSGTLSVETWYAVERARYRHVRLEAAPPATHPVRIDVIDARHQRRGWPLIFSVALEDALRRTLDKHGQALLLLNRRGFATWIYCKTCKTVRRCPACQAAFVYHFGRKELVCHTCQSRQPAVELCPVCDSRYLRYQGLGTEKVVSETCRLFPAARVARLDLDAAHEERHAVEAMAGKLARGELDVLVGTQLITRLPSMLRVALVGVISADTALHVPDFRAGERTFALLRSLIARATERVIIQTTTPDHEAIRAAARQEAARFYRDELQTRRALGLPPFRQLVRLTLAGPRESALVEACGALAERLPSAVDGRGMEVIGPAPVMVQRRHGTRPMWQLLLKGRRLPPLLDALRRVIGPQRRFQGVQVRVDVDPY